MQWALSCSKVLYSSGVSSSFKLVRIEAVRALSETLNWHEINNSKNQRHCSSNSKMLKSISKLDSLKDLLDVVGASDALNGGKTVSWLHSSACERS